MTDWKAEFGKDFDKYVMHGKFRDSNFADTVVESDRKFFTYHGVEILTHWICGLGFEKRLSQDTNSIEDLFLRLDTIMQENICGDFLRAFPDRAREIYIDCCLHIENTDEEMEG